jgi:hypothetical protein
MSEVTIRSTCSGLLVFFLLAIFAYEVSAQSADLERHAEVKRIDGDVVVADMSDSVRVAVSATGILWNSAAGRKGAVRVDSLENARTVRCTITEEAQPPEVGDFIAFKELRALLRIRSEPSGADIYVDDTHWEQNPTLALVPGTYEIEAELSGYRTRTETVDLRSGERRLLILRLLEE